ncbi:MAG: hypothetical protein AABW65_02820 [Nanoarchaeota archaeon]
MEKNIKKKPKKNSKNQEFRYIIAAMTSLIIVFLVFYLLFQGAKTIRYEGLTFTKTKLGEIPLYHYYYYFTGDDGQQYKYNLYLRNNPKKNNVSINGEIAYPRGTYVYLAINTSNLLQCPNLLRDIHSLSSFLHDNLAYSNIGLLSGVPDEQQAVENNITHVSCETYPNNVVITLQSGSETKIEKIENCHIVSISQCQTTEAIEKFEVKSILDAKRRTREN